MEKSATEETTPEIKPVGEMTDRELLEEVVRFIRELPTAMERQFSSNPMLKSIMGMFAGRK
jgi:hypothetical protein